MDKNNIVKFITTRETYSRDICNDYKKMSKSFFLVGFLLIAILLFVAHVIEVRLYKKLLILLPIILGMIISVIFGRQYDGKSTYNVLKVDAMTESARVLMLGGTLLGLASVMLDNHFLIFYMLALGCAVSCIPLYSLFISKMIKTGNIIAKHYKNISNLQIFAIMGIFTTVGLFGDKEQVVSTFAVITPFIIVLHEYTMVKKILRLHYAKKYPDYMKDAFNV